MERVGDRYEKIEGQCSTGQSPQWAVLPMEEEEYLLPRNKNLEESVQEFYLWHMFVHLSCNVFSITWYRVIYIFNNFPLCYFTIQQTKRG